MSFFDLFKKSPKKEPEKTTASKAAKPSSDETFMSPEMQKKRYDAAMEFLEAFQDRMPLVNGKPHAGTVLSVAARLAGTSLYRSLHYKNNAVPGVVVLSNEVNEAWSQLANLFAFYCKQNGFDIMAKPMVTQFPEKDKPLMSVDQVLQEYQDQFHAIMKKHGLDYLNGARAGIVVASIIFQYHCAKVKDIAPDVAAGIVAMGIVEGAKTAPPPLKSAGGVSAMRAGSAPQNDPFAELLRSVAVNSTDGSGARLILGEGMDAMKESLASGGKYILVHPAVAAQLQQTNIDPYLIYESAMRIEMEHRIPRIDFVNTEVEKLLKEWHGKLPTQAPIHVRLLSWLKENAHTYSYEQNGNSWVLKD
ncbi:MAG: hypothetical protein QM730_06750 [Anaerolineales bacterium]